MAAEKSREKIGKKKGKLWLRFCINYVNKCNRKHKISWCGGKHRIYFVERVNINSKLYYTKKLDKMVVLR